MINSSELSFHETFKPELIYVAKILKLAMNEYSGTKYEISESSGIPTGDQKGKVIPHIKYAAYMGLISYKLDRGVFYLTPTKLGCEVYDQDPYLREDLSAWICHYNMTKKIGGATQWTYIVHCVHPGFENPITQDRIFNLARSWCDVKEEQMSRKVFSVVKGSYTEGCFEKLNFLSWNNDICFHEQKEKFDMLYVYAYALIDSWQQMFPDKREITDNEMKENLGFPNIFGFNDEECNYVIESLRDEGIITVNRQLYPATIIRTTNIEEIIPNLFSRLL